jgi:phospholipid transport system substrate-binding protein
MRIVILLFLLAATFSLRAAAPSPPDQMVRAAVRQMADLVADCRLQLATDPPALRGLTDQYLRPKVDILYAGQLILGRSWTEATPEQRRRFSEAFYGTLASRYSSGLLLLTQQRVEVVPSDAPPEGGEAVVQLLAQAGLAAPLPIELQMRLGGERWRVYDARWEGQSYVLSLRQAVAQEIGRHGLESVIQRLEATAGEPVGPPAQRATAAGRCLKARETSL